MVANIYSDNGTNFVGASRELRNLQRLFQSKEETNNIGNFLAENSAIYKDYSNQRKKPTTSETSWPIKNLSSFINALRRFIARRGMVANIYSDNGTNFVGANRELRNLQRLFQSKEETNNIGNFLANKGINWHSENSAIYKDYSNQRKKPTTSETSWPIKV
ncbi:hypothetical protein QE152_g12585 [Popillia japonica]|uniref:Integrase catalytic domain-containing protein n=1 Tax=Popillia japonica TaxID=7064 RepID=A0AAW1LQQ2_POPJA